MTCQIHQDDIGTVFKTKIIDCETGAVIDISASTSRRIKFLLPDLTVVEKAAVFTTDGTDGYIQYVTVAGDLSQSGRWKIQGFIADAGFENNSSVEEFNVLSNLS